VFSFYFPLFFPLFFFLTEVLRVFAEVIAVIRINVSWCYLRISRPPQNLINESPEFSLPGTSPYLKFRMTALRRIINGAVELPVFHTILQWLPATRFIRWIASTYFARFAPWRPSKAREKEREQKREKVMKKEGYSTRMSFRVDYNSIDIRNIWNKITSRARDIFWGAFYRSGYVATVALIAIDD